MKSIDIVLTVAAALVIFAMVYYPIQESNNKIGLTEIALENHESLELYQKHGFIVDFSINNLDENPLTTIYELKRDEFVLKSEMIYLNPGEKKYLSYYNDYIDRKYAHKYTISLVNSAESIHFWTLPNSTFVRDLESGPDVDHDLPWELQDPILQEFYRYG